VADLRSTLKRFEPLDRDTKRFAALLATRQADIRRAIHNLNLVTNAFGGVEGQLASLIRASDTNFSAIAANDAQLQQTLTEFPPTLRQSITTLNKVRGFANASTVTLAQLQPFARNLGPALRASWPLFHDTTPVIANQLRPFSVAVQPLARTLAAGAPKLKATIPSLTSSISVINTLFNELAHRPGGGQQSYLFWGAWLAHIADSLVSTQDANGAVLQGIFMNTCAGLNFYEKQLEPGSAPLGAILDLLNAPDVGKLPGATPSVIPGQVNCPS
jgi:phospholipid/cholesterol/gamma-HCH transport system substrate-binding protein